MPVRFRGQYLNDTHEASVAAYTPDEQSQREALFSQIAAIEADLFAHLRG